MLEEEMTQEAIMKPIMDHESCNSCGICHLFCPSSCIATNEETDSLEIDYDFCIGCGICAAVCPKGAIEMIIEEVKR